MQLLQAIRSNSSSATALMRELASAYHAYHAYDAAYLRQFDMTPAQADVVCHLGTAGVMTCGELAEMAAIPRGSLSATLERLEDRGLVLRKPSRTDRRRIHVRLTKQGSSVFGTLFSGRVSRMAERFDQLDERTQALIMRALRELRDLFM